MHGVESFPPRDGLARVKLGFVLDEFEDIGLMPETVVYCDTQTHETHEVLEDDVPNFDWQNFDLNKLFQYPPEGLGFRTSGTAKALGKSEQSTYRLLRKAGIDTRQAGTHKKSGMEPRALREERKKAQDDALLADRMSTWTTEYNHDLKALQDIVLGDK